ncbi:hypothetical protein L7F22_049562 [Adiantum nelumboides]|nr:hypothetical protein [Adiantum nelumboides]
MDLQSQLTRKEAQNHELLKNEKKMKEQIKYEDARFQKLNASYNTIKNTLTALLQNQEPATAAPSTSDSAALNTLAALQAELQTEKLQRQLLVSGFMSQTAQHEAKAKQLEEELAKAKAELAAVGSLASISHIQQAETHVPIQPPQLPEMLEFQGTEEEEQQRPARGALDIREEIEQEIEDLPEGPAKEYREESYAIGGPGILTARRAESQSLSTVVMAFPHILLLTVVTCWAQLEFSIAPACLAARTRPPYASPTTSSSPSLHELSADSLFPNGTGVTRGDFPEGFLFGAITSAMKHEGAEYRDNKSENIWDVYARKTDASMDGSLPGESGNNYDLYKLDHRLLTGLGMNSYRFSIAWSRMFPNGSGEVNEVAIAHYNDVIDDILSLGLVPMVTLWTQDHPQILEERYGGALSETFISDFANYAEACFKAFGDRVKYWITFDELNDWAGLGYSTDQNPPGRCTSNITGQGNSDYGECAQGNSGTEPYIAAHHLLLAHAEAVDVYRTKYQPTQNGSIGFAVWFRWSEPLTNSTEDVIAAQRATDFLVGWVMDPIFFGDYPDSMRELVGARLPNFTAEQLQKLNGSLDFVGINVQTALYAFDTNFYLTQNEKCYYLDWQTNFTGYRDGVAIGKGDHDFAVPWCLRKTVEYVKDRYNNFPMFITQTGWGIFYYSFEETLEDDERVEFFETHYTELVKAIREGANVKGVYAWSLIDGFEFNLGRKLRVGIFDVDDDYNRYPRKSALWFKEMLASNSATSSTATAAL